MRRSVAPFRRLRPAYLVGKAMMPSILAAHASSAVVMASPSHLQQVRAFQTFRIRPEDVKMFEDELRRRQDEIDQEADEDAFEVKTDGPTKYTGVASEDVRADETVDDTTKASTGDETADDAVGDTAESSSAAADTPAGAEDVAAQPSVSSSNDLDSADFLYGGVSEADRRARADAIRSMYDDPTPGDVAVARGRMAFTRADDEFAIMMQRAAAKKRQQGPFVDRTVDQLERFDVDERHRRAIDRVPQMEQPYEANETSFRRLPKGFKLPEEHQLRAMYPMATNLPIEWSEADCVDGDAQDIYARNPHGIKYGMIKPPNYDETKAYPVMVVLSDGRGLELDFEDLCGNFFERDEYLRGIYEQEWVIISPIINVKHSQAFPTEGVVARFIEWVRHRFRCENGRPHLFGRGLGGFLAMRTCTYHHGLVISVTAVLGRMAAPFRPLERPQQMIHNMEGTHSLVFIPGGTRKLDWMYKWKGLMDLSKVSPPTRFVHFAEVFDAQSVYAINPNEFWNYMLYFRRNPLHDSVGGASETSRVAAEEAEERRSWDSEAFKDYTDKNGDPLGTVTYEWLSRRDGSGPTAEEKGKTQVAADGTVA